MGRPKLGPGVLGPLRTIFEEGATGLRSDAELLDRVARGDGGESAFSSLVDRHRGMVLRTCRGILGDPHAAEDAAQVTFLVLASKAGGLRRGETIAPWLYGVAVRVSSKMRVKRARRAKHERVGAGLRGERLSPTERDDTGPVVLEEVGRLSENERAPIVLCYFEGLSHEEAARRLGWPVGTVRGRLARARDRLRGRLRRRGLEPTAGVLSAWAGGPAGEMVPVSSGWMNSTVSAAMRIAGGGPGAAGAVPEALSVAAKDALQGMIMTKAKMVGAMVLVSTMIAGGAAGLAQFGGEGFGGGPEAQTPPRKERVAEPREERAPAKKVRAPAEEMPQDSMPTGTMHFDGPVEFMGANPGGIAGGLGFGSPGPASISGYISEIEDDPEAMDALVEVAVIDAMLAKLQYEKMFFVLMVEIENGQEWFLDDGQALMRYRMLREEYIDALAELAMVRGLLKERGYSPEDLPPMPEVDLEQPPLPLGAETPESPPAF